jgi:putative transposase
MPPVVAALLALVSSLWRSRWALHLQVLALQHQVAVYKQTVRRPRLSPTDRVFWSWLSSLWAGWLDVLAFVQSRTVIAWQHTRVRDYWRGLSQQGSSGRPDIAKGVHELIREMWRANPTWGSPRIVGKLRKLGLEVAKSTVEKYRVWPRKPPSPTWKTFLNNHVKDLVALDFFIDLGPSMRCIL